MSEQVKNLLMEAQKVADEYARNRASGAEFNIFDLFYADHKEVDICYIICDLLSPDGSHGQGAVFLEKFFASVLDNMLFPKGEIKVSSQFRISVDVDGATKYRFIDLVIEADDTFIPIEVKIYAPDQPKQCSDYWREIENKCPNSQNRDIWYLTLDGKKPSKISLSDMDTNRVKTISFEKQICDWLKDCLAEAGRRNIPNVETVLRQFLAAVRKWTGQPDCTEYGKLKSSLEKDVDKLLLADRMIKNDVTAVELPPGSDERVLRKYLKKAVDDLKRSLPRRILAKFDEKMDAAFMKTHGLALSSANPCCEKAIMCDYYNNSRNILRFFKYEESYVMANRIFPQKQLDDGHDLCFCFGLGHTLFAQIFIFNYAAGKFEPINEDYLNKVGLRDKVEAMLAESAVWCGKDPLKESFIEWSLVTKISSKKDWEKYDDEILKFFDDAVLEQWVNDCVKNAETELLRKFFKQAEREEAQS